MTVDEAIKNAEELAELNEDQARVYREQDDIIGAWSYEECANEHRHLAEWLRELKKYRSIFEKVGKILADNGYTIDDLVTIFGKVNEEVNTDEN